MYGNGPFPYDIAYRYLRAQFGSALSCRVSMPFQYCFHVVSQVLLAPPNNFGLLLGKALPVSQVTIKCYQNCGPSAKSVNTANNLRLLGSRGIALTFCRLGPCPASFLRHWTGHIHAQTHPFGPRHNPAWHMWSLGSAPD